MCVNNVYVNYLKAKQTDRLIFLHQNERMNSDLIRCSNKANRKSGCYTVSHTLFRRYRMINFSIELQQSEQQPGLYYFFFLWGSSASDTWLLSLQSRARGILDSLMETGLRSSLTLNSGKQECLNKQGLKSWKTYHMVADWLLEMYHFQTWIISPLHISSICINNKQARGRKIQYWSCFF